MTTQELTREEYCARFKAHMLKTLKEFDDGSSVAEYADEAALAYFEEYASGSAFGEEPEDAAETDISYWGE